MRKTLSSIALCFALSFSVVAQTAKPEPPKAPPVLTELEQARIENVQLKFALIQEQQAQLQALYQTLLKAIETEHPGYRYDAQAKAIVAIPKK